MHKAVGSMRTLRMIRMVRLVRVLRVLRLAKAARHSQLLNIVIRGLRSTDSGFLAIVMLMLFMMVIFASLIYFFESEGDIHGEADIGPQAFNSIPASFWWAIVTLTTVGYGDMVPTTIYGKVIGGFTAVTGVILSAIAVNLISINFKESYALERAKVVGQSGKAGGAAPRRLAGYDRHEIEELATKQQSTTNELIAKASRVLEDVKLELPQGQEAGTELVSLELSMKRLQANAQTFNRDMSAFLFAVLIPELERMQKDDRTKALNARKASAVHFAPGLSSRQSVQ